MNKLQERKWIRKIKLFGSSKDADSLVRFYYDEILLTNHFIDSDFEKKFVQSELLEKVEHYISSFQTDIQQIFRLHIFGEQTFREIANLIQIPEETVKTKYYRLIKQIRREFYEEYREIINN